MSATITQIDNLADMSDEDLAAEIVRAQRSINHKVKHAGTPTREEGHRRLTRARDALTARIAAAESAATYELAHLPDGRHLDLLTSLASLRALAGDDGTWAALNARIDGEPHPGTADPWGFTTDADADEAKREGAAIVSDGRRRFDALTAEKNRRERKAADDRERVRVEQYRAARR